MVGLDAVQRLEEAPYDLLAFGSIHIYFLSTYKAAVEQSASAKL